MCRIRVSQEAGLDLHGNRTRSGGRPIHAASDLRVNSDWRSKKTSLDGEKEHLCANLLGIMKANVPIKCVFLPLKSLLGSP